MPISNTRCCLKNDFIEMNYLDLLWFGESLQYNLSYTILFEDVLWTSSYVLSEFDTNSFILELIYSVGKAISS